MMAASNSEFDCPGAPKNTNLTNVEDMGCFQVQEGQCLLVVSIVTKILLLAMQASMMS